MSNKIVELTAHRAQQTSPNTEAVRICNMMIACMGYLREIAGQCGEGEIVERHDGKRVTLAQTVEDIGLDTCKLARDIRWHHCHASQNTGGNAA